MAPRSPRTPSSCTCARAKSRGRSQISAVAPHRADLPRERDGRGRGSVPGAVVDDDGGAGQGVHGGRQGGPVVRQRRRRRQSGLGLVASGARWAATSSGRRRRRAAVAVAAGIPAPPPGHPPTATGNHLHPRAGRGRGSDVVCLWAWGTKKLREEGRYISGGVWRAVGECRRGDWRADSGGSSRLELCFFGERWLDLSWRAC
jgi:hypothetical protein